MQRVSQAIFNISRRFNILSVVSTYSAFSPDHLFHRLRYQDSVRKHKQPKQDTTMEESTWLVS